MVVPLLVFASFLVAFLGEERIWSEATAKAGPRRALCSAESSRVGILSSASMRNLNLSAAGDAASRVSTDESSSASSIEDEHGRRDHRRPQPAFIPDRRLRHVGGADDLVGDAIDFFFLVPRSVGIKLHVQSGGQHFGGEFFGVVSGGVFCLTERVVLAQISVGVAIGGGGDANRGGQQAVGLVRGVFGNHRKYDFAGRQIGESLRARDQFAVGRKDGRDT